MRAFRKYFEMFWKSFGNLWSCCNLTLFRELEDLEVLRQEVTRPRTEVEFNKTPLKVILQKKNQLSLDTKVLHFTRFSRPAQSRVKMVLSSPQLSNRTTNLPEVLKTQWTGQWVLSRQGPHLTRWQVGWGTWLVSEKETNILMLSFSSWTKCLLTLTHPAMRCANKCF